MIEIAVGLVVIAGMLAVLSLGLLPIIGTPITVIVLALGALLVAAGFARRAIAAAPGRRHALRTARMTGAGLVATAALAIGLPFTAEPLHLVRLDGVSLGYYLTAPGAFLGLVALAFLWAARQNRIDAEEHTHD